MHCNLRPPEPRQSRLNYDAMPSLKSLDLSLPHYSVFAADTLLYAVTLTFDPVMLNISSVSLMV